MHEQSHAKTDLKALVVVIPKEGMGKRILQDIRLENIMYGARRVVFESFFRMTWFTQGTIM